MSGLTGYDGSLYREWLMEHPGEQADAPGDDAEHRLSYHSYTQDTMLLAALYNLLLARFTDGKHDPPYILQPGQPDPKKKGTHESLDLSHATADTMLAFLMKTV